MTASNDSSFDDQESSASTTAAEEERNDEKASSSSSSGSFAIRLCDALAAFCAATTFIVGFTLYTTSLNGVVQAESTTLEKLVFIQENETLYYVSNLVLYIIFGLAQLVLTYAMTRRLRVTFPETSALAQGLGIIWVTLVLAAGMIGNVGTKTALKVLSDDDNEPERATALWDAVRTIHTSIGGGNEIVGGSWVLLVSLCEFLSFRYYHQTSSAAAASTSTGTTTTTNNNRPVVVSVVYSKVTAAIGIAAGLAGIVHTVPVLENAGAVFGLLMIVWYIMVGILIICKSNQQA